MTRIEYNGMTFSDADDQIVSGEIYNAVSLISDVIEIGTFKAEVRVSNDTDGVKLRNFKRNDKLVCFHNDRQLGIWYVENVERTSKYTYEISANNAVSLLDGSTHYGGIYTGQTAGEIIADICTIRNWVKPAMAEQKLYGWLPAASRRSNLAQVLFAIGAYTWVDETGLLRIDQLWDGVSNYIGEDSIMTGDKVKYASKITKVSVLEHQYVQGDEDVTLFEGTAANGDIITFREPAHSITASGVTILERGANYVKISSGSGIVTGKKYIHTTRDIRLSVSASDIESVKEVKNATLVSLTNSMAVAQRLAEYYKCCETVQHDAVFRNQAPGDVISFDHPFDGDVVGCIKSTGIEIGAQKIVVEDKIVSGFLPPQNTSIEYYDRRELIASNSNFTIPDGVKTIRVVLIGGGSGGSGGGNGTSGTAGGSASISRSQNGTSTGSKGSAGDGGAKGVAGSGGKIAVLDLEVTPGSVMNFSIGQGGSGGSAGGNAGSSGGATTLTVDGDVHSSNDGSVSAGGYVDTTTGEAFAVPGQDGVAGAKGGSAGDVNNAGSAGASVGQNAGGAGNSSAAIIDSGSVKGSWVYDRHSISYGSYDSVYSTSSFTGYSGYTTDSNGRLKYSGSKKTVGVVSGSVVTGTIYTDLYTDPSMDSNGYLQDLIVEITIESGDTSSRCWRKKRNVWSSIYYKRSTAQYTKAILPAGGGGAAKGVSGSSATSSCAGGNGAAASAPSAPTTYGAGGNGGNGGGGGGAGGAGYAQISGNDSSVGMSASQAGGSGGSGGSGSAGSKGANGCAILYFGEPHVLPHGAVMDKKGRFAIDKTGRLMVV